MPNVFVTSDTHFGHANILTFLKNDGTKLRPWDAVEEMDAALIKNWNNVVRPHDKIYHLGDIAISKKSLDVLAQLNGDKVLIKGNHDIYRLGDYAKYFRDIRAYHVMDRLIFSHIPIHSGSKQRFKGNVHGHTHSNFVLDEAGNKDPWYLPVSVEQTNYTPIALENIRSYYESVDR